MFKGEPTPSTLWENLVGPITVCCLSRTGSSLGFSLAEVEVGSAVSALIIINPAADSSLEGGDRILSVNGKCMLFAGISSCAQELQAVDDTSTLVVQRLGMTLYKRLQVLSNRQQALANHIQVSRKTIAKPSTDIHSGEIAPIAVDPPSDQHHHEELKVVLTKAADDTSFGFGIFTENLASTVDNIAPRGLAVNKLKIGDTLVSINGQNISGCSNDVIAREIGSAESVELGIKRLAQSNSEKKADNESSTTDNDMVEIILTRDGLADGFGFGFGETSNGDLTITEVRQGTPSAGNLAKGDIVKVVNGQPVAGRPYVGVVQEIGSCLKVQFVVHRGAINAAQTDRRMSISGLAQPADDVSASQHGEMVEVVLTRDSVSTGFGFGIGETTQGDVTITDTRQGTPSDGNLAKGDIVKVVNGRDVGGRPHTEIVQEIGSCVEVHFVVLRGAIDTAKIHVGGCVSLRSLKRMSMASMDTPATDMIGVVLTRDSFASGFGFDIGETSNGDLTVTDVRTSTPSEGNLAKGDIVRMVNEKPVAGRLHNEIVQEISSCLEVQFVVHRGAITAGHIDLKLSSSSLVVPAEDAAAVETARNAVSVSNKTTAEDARTTRRLYNYGDDGIQDSTGASRDASRSSRDASRSSPEQPQQIPSGIVVDSASKFKRPRHLSVSAPQQRSGVIGQGASTDDGEASDLKVHNQGKLGEVLSIDIPDSKIFVRYDFNDSNGLVVIGSVPFQLDLDDDDDAECAAVGDVLLGVDNKLVCGQDADDIKAMLDELGSHHVTLVVLRFTVNEFEFSTSASAFQADDYFCAEQRGVHIRRDIEAHRNQTWGFEVQGGCDTALGGVFVSAVDAKTASFDIAVGDRILTCNGQSMVSLYMLKYFVEWSSSA